MYIYLKQLNYFILNNLYNKFFILHRATNIYISYKPKMPSSQE